MEYVNNKSEFIKAKDGFMAVRRDAILKVTIRFRENCFRVVDIKLTNGDEVCFCFNDEEEAKQFIASL